MHILRYDEWSDTALTLHLVSQMLGKTKVARMEPQPEWYHTVLHLTPDGFSTGLIPNGDRSFSISMLLRESKVVTTGIDGRTSGFAFEDGRSVSEYHKEFNRMLADVMCETELYTVPQEMSTTTPFEKDTQSRSYNSRHAMDFFRMCVFAHNSILRFVAPFRGKKLLPSFFWGTFDTTGILYSGKSRPYSGKGIIEQVAFAEQLIEFGFWPGDSSTAEPSFFILPYPFLTEDLANAPIAPDKAIYSKDKAEFFLTLKDAMSYDVPEQAVFDFFQSGYTIVTQTEKWENLDWLNKPLPIEKGSVALKK